MMPSKGRLASPRPIAIHTQTYHYFPCRTCDGADGDFKAQPSPPQGIITNNTFEPAQLSSPSDVFRLKSFVTLPLRVSRRLRISQPSTMQSRRNKPKHVSTHGKHRARCELRAHPNLRSSSHPNYHLAPPQSLRAPGPGKSLKLVGPVFLFAFSFCLGAQKSHTHLRIPTPVVCAPHSLEHARVFIEACRPSFLRSKMVQVHLGKKGFVNDCGYRPSVGEQSLDKTNSSGILPIKVFRARSLSKTIPSDHVQKIPGLAFPHLTLRCHHYTTRVDEIPLPVPPPSPTSCTHFAKTPSQAPARPLYNYWCVHFHNHIRPWDSP
ncbi:hypothetical protein LZ31DRAFT_50969 [Colletotrichum somersetense]|nr:hypothetical protein LZ31DRAFT_50969 [Colletotrichum somersetense]